jgi:hypothetical protein
MKRIEKVTLVFSQGAWRIPELHMEASQIFDGSGVLRGHGLKDNEIRSQDDAYDIAKQVVDAINAAGGIEITNLNYAWVERNCPPGVSSWECKCDRFVDAGEDTC